MITSETRLPGADVVTSEGNADSSPLDTASPTTNPSPFLARSVSQKFMPTACNGCQRLDNLGSQDVEGYKTERDEFASLSTSSSLYATTVEALATGSPFSKSCLCLCMLPLH